jgi:Domain of unknown function (DUF397)
MKQVLDCWLFMRTAKEVAQQSNTSPNPTTSNSSSTRPTRCYIDTLPPLTIAACAIIWASGNPAANIGKERPMANLQELDWRKARESVGSGACVEAAGTGDGGVAIRNSRDPKGPALTFTGPEFAAFCEGVKKGEFDGLIIER